MAHTRRPSLCCDQVMLSKPAAPVSVQACRVWCVYREWALLRWHYGVRRGIPRPQRASPAAVALALLTGRCMRTSQRAGRATLGARLPHLRDLCNCACNCACTLHLHTCIPARVQCTRSVLRRCGAVIGRWSRRGGHNCQMTENEMGAATLQSRAGRLGWCIPPDWRCRPPPPLVVDDICINTLTDTRGHTCACALLLLNAA